MMDKNFSIKTKELTKSFPGVVAIKKVNMEFKSGEVHAIVGANGAGKSTFAKILAGVYPDYEGEVQINEQTVLLNSPHKSFSYGISIVYQEVDTALVPYFTAAENLFLIRNNKDKKRRVVSQLSFLREARLVLEKHNIHLDLNLDSLVSELSVSKKQLLLIAKAVIYGSKFIIFDEPTASLGPQEVEALFKVIKSLKNRNLGIIYISHRMPEVFEIADKISVFRNGEKVETFEKNTTDVNTVVKAMLGEKQISSYFQKEENKNFKDLILSVKNLYKKDLVGPLSFDLHKGEILGITGLIGAGKTEMLKVLFGAIENDKLEITLDGEKINILTTKDATHNGIYMVPEERRKEGLIVNENIEWNLTLPNLNELSFFSFMINPSRNFKISTETFKQLNIKAYSPSQLVKNLSGGNQQKVAIGKWLIKQKLKGAKVMIFDEPTVGIDIESKEEIYILAQEIANMGLGVIFSSSDIDEVIRVADRIIIMYKGKIVGLMKREEFDSEKILLMSTGGHEINSK